MSADRRGTETMGRIFVIVPTPLQQFTEGKSTAEVDADTVEAALNELTRRHSSLRRHLFAEGGRLRSFINIYLNDEDIRYLEGGEGTGVEDGDEIRIVPSIAGGNAVT